MSVEHTSNYRLCLKGWVYSCILIVIVAGVHVFFNELSEWLKHGRTDFLDYLIEGRSYTFFNIILKLVFFLFVTVIVAVALFFLIFIIGSPIYGAIFIAAIFFSKLQMKTRSLTFEKFFIISFLIFGTPLAICAVYYSLSDFKNLDAFFLHMTPFYAFVLVPFNIGFMWLNVVEKNV